MNVPHEMNTSARGKLLLINLEIDSLHFSRILLSGLLVPFRISFSAVETVWVYNIEQNDLKAAGRRAWTTMRVMESTIGVKHSTKLEIMEIQVLWLLRIEKLIHD